jgi:serine/threonine-protein kinase
MPSAVVVQEEGGRGDPDDVARLRGRRPRACGSSSATSTIITTALKKAPGERYASIAAFEADLRRFLRHEPIAARPDRVHAACEVRPPAPGVGRLCRRGRRGAGRGLAGTTILARHANAQAERADRQAAEASAHDYADATRARRSDQRPQCVLIADAAPMGASVTARDLLARAEHIVGRQADDANGARLESLISLGSLYSVIGEQAHASAALQRAYRLAASSDDPTLKARASCNGRVSRYRRHGAPRH